MVFSTDNLLRRETIDNAPSNLVITVNEKTSFFVEAMNFLLEEDNLLAEYYDEINIPTYNSRKKLLLIEADKNININLNVNTPGSRMIAKAKETGSGIFNFMKTNFTIEKIVKFIINSFITIITRIWREFEAICMSIVSKNSQIKRLEAKIYSIPVSFKFYGPLFNYTHIREENSRADFTEIINNIYDECNLFIQSFSSIKNSSTEIENAIKVFNKSESNDEYELEELRGRLLGLNTLISKSDYAECLFRYFRDNATIANENITLTPEDIRIRLGNWNVMPKVIKGYQRDKDKLEKAGKDLVTKLEKNNLDKYLDTVPASTLDLFSNLILRYGTKIKETCEVFVIYYANRLDAAKEELKTNTKILYNVAKYITKEGL